MQHYMDMDFNIIPAGAPPPGVQPNLVNPHTLLAATIATAVIIHVITLGFVVARVYTNVLNRRIYPEDVFLYLAWFAFIAETGLTIHNSDQGMMARHMWDMSIATVNQGSYRYTNIFVCYAISGGFAKATVFLQVKKIFTTKQRGAVYWVIMVSLVANAVAYMSLLFIYVFNCWPLAKRLNPDLPGHCIDWQSSVIAIGAVNLLSDIEAFVVPAWAIWQLQMNIKKKLEVFAVFAVGAVAVGTACIGLHYRVLVLTAYDTTWYLAQTAMLCMVELGSVIIVGCCPSIPRIVRRHQLKVASASSDYSETWGNSAAKTTVMLRRDTQEEYDDFTQQHSGSEEMLEMYNYGNSVEQRGSESIIFRDSMTNTAGTLQMPARVHNVRRVEKPEGWI
ncbi:integral membrane [Pyrenophora seminiperda CCB06]|uniref:Integral membrane n=1 Tax=Pyrenophora seminiperda CCB06 TaxID=1302712 RepID=A0A3M7LYP6_9PLEO|nr:integral membrane [Pyrenophora seminiperda CCB06]